jgi:hypothetical protein
MKKSPVPFPAVLKASCDGTLSPILRHAHELLRIEAVIRELLPRNLQHRFRVANLHGRRLVLTTDSPAWATRLRCQLPDVLRRLEVQAHTKPIGEIDVKVTLPKSRPTSSHQHRARVSAKTADLLRDFANGCDNGLLQAALLRLASRR